MPLLTYIRGVRDCQSCVISGNVGSVWCPCSVCRVRCGVDVLAVAAGVFLSGGGGKLGQCYQHMCCEAFFSLITAAPGGSQPQTAVLLLQLFSSDSSTRSHQCEEKRKWLLSKHPTQLKYRGLETDWWHSDIPYTIALCIHYIITFYKIREKNASLCLWV